MASQPIATRHHLPSRVLKLGGSLLDLPHLGDRLRNWLDGESEKMTLLVSGGGGLVETMRLLDAVHDFDASWSHWRCIELMQMTSQIIQTQLPGWLAVKTPSELKNCFNRSLPELRAIVFPTAYYTPELASQDEVGDRLPETWETTSDSLAAYLARKISADELVLLKSTTPHSATWSQPGMVCATASPTSDDLSDWQRTGLVDGYFVKAAASIGLVRTVNLRKCF